jgi:hypothetical protein
LEALRLDALRPAEVGVDPNEPAGERDVGRGAERVVVAEMLRGDLHHGLARVGKRDLAQPQHLLQFVRTGYFVSSGRLTAPNYFVEQNSRVKKSSTKL